MLDEVPGGTSNWKVLLMETTACLSYLTGFHSHPQPYILKEFIKGVLKRVAKLKEEERDIVHRGGINE